MTSGTTLSESAHADVGRQAVVAGLVHFAASAGCQVIAEGIETDAELASVSGLGVTLGQGYLLARPAGADPTDATRSLRPTLGCRCLAQRAKHQAREPARYTVFALRGPQEAVALDLGSGAPLQLYTMNGRGSDSAPSRSIENVADRQSMEARRSAPEADQTVGRPHRLGTLACTSYAATDRDARAVARDEAAERGDLRATAIDHGRPFGRCWPRQPSGGKALR